MMRALSSSDLLALWERGHRLHSLDQGLLALSMAGAKVEPNSVADWPLGRRNRALLKLHTACFSPQLQAWAACSSCGEKMEFELDAAALAGSASDENAGADPLVQVRDRMFRLPNSRDLAQAAGQEGPLAAIAILERCRTDGGAPCSWSEEEIEEIGEAMAQADPAAEIRISLCCPGCCREWDEPIDIAGFLWAEIDAHARRMLWEVHALASIYGWSEAEILKLSQARRSLYLSMVQA